MIELHRLSHPGESLYLNPDHVHSVESTPDTVVTLASGMHVVVRESPEEVADLVRRFRAEVIALAQTIAV
jgi:flagellar protein FlbD